MSVKTLNPVQFVSFSLLWMISGALSVLDWLALRSAITDRRSVCAGDFGPLCVFEHLRPGLLLSSRVAQGRDQKRFALATAIQVGILAISGVIALATASMV